VIHPRELRVRLAQSLEVLATEARREPAEEALEPAARARDACENGICRAGERRS
jgi:hypothetical protein